MIALAGVGFLFFLIIAGANQNMNPFLDQEYGIGLSTAGFLTTVWGLGVTLGGVTGGGTIRRLGGQNAVRSAVFVSLIAVAALALVPGPVLAWPLAALFGLAYGTCQTVFFSLAMGHTDTRIAASMFSILMAVTNVAQGVGMALAGSLADSIGFRWTFGILAAINLLVLPLLPALYRKTEQETT